MVLVDSSVWIALLRNQASRAVAALHCLLQDRQAALSPIIYQEILQGAVSSAHFDTLREYFSAQPFLVLLHPVRSHEEAAHLYARCRWQGVTPRSPADCVVAQTALEQEVELLAHERDFNAIAAVESRLRLYEWDRG
ncbi:MAG: type II toxin-antitoxin system VapC family toxin [Rhodanobacteraceae bacterium]